MDLQWLLPEQIEQILRLCDLSSIEDPTIAANLLQSHQWNLENALNEIVQGPRPTTTNPKPVSNVPRRVQHNSSHSVGEQDFEIPPEHYEQLGLAGGHKNILKQQNKEYEQMEKNYIAKLAEEEQLKQYYDAMDKEFESHKAQLSTHKVERPIQIKFRLPQRIETFIFDLSDPVQKVFSYVSGHLRQGFEHKYADFDLTQSFSPLSLKKDPKLRLEQVFGDSAGEVLIVKEI